MSFNLSQMFQQLGVPAIVVATVLLAMGLASLTVFIERILTLRRSRAASRKFSSTVNDDLQAGRFDPVIEVAEAHAQGHLARVVRAGLTTYRHAQKTADVSGLTPVEQT